MKSKDVKIGMKVVPFKKTAYIKNLAQSVVWQDAQAKNQPYLFVCGRKQGCGWELSDKETDHGFDYFNAGDFKPYIES